MIPNKKNDYQKNLNSIISDNISGDNKTSLENEISKDLDNYILNSGENLINLPIETLYNIFNNSRSFTLHNEAYKLITQNTNNQEKYILLRFIDANRIKQEYVNESIELYEQRNFFVPKNTFSVFLNSFSKKIYLIGFLIFTFVIVCSILNSYHSYLVIQKKDNVINSLIQAITNQSSISNERLDKLEQGTQNAEKNMSRLINQMNNQTQFSHSQRKLIAGSLFFFNKK